MRYHSFRHGTCAAQVLHIPVRQLLLTSSKIFSPASNIEQSSGMCTIFSIPFNINFTSHEFEGFNWPSNSAGTLIITLYGFRNKVRWRVKATTVKKSCIKNSNSNILPYIIICSSWSSTAPDVECWQQWPNLTILFNFTTKTNSLKAIINIYCAYIKENL